MQALALYTRAAAVLTKARCVQHTVKKRRTCFLLLLTSMKSTNTAGHWGVVYLTLKPHFGSLFIYFDGVCQVDGFAQLFVASRAVIG